jgi:hypothetical protein
LFASQCGSIATTTQRGDSLLLSGSFPVNTDFRLVLVITDPDTTYPHYPAILMTGTAATIPLLPAGSLPPGVHSAEWIMAGCLSADQTLIPGPKTITIA